MAGQKFPLAYFDTTATANDYGGTDVRKSLYYVIHNVNNQPIFSPIQTGIDVYTFKEEDDSDSAQRSYAVIMIKNTGATGSLLKTYDIVLDSSEENAGFSLVTSIADITGAEDFDFSGIDGVITPTAFAAIVNDASIGGAVLTSPSPICYLAINTSTGNVDTSSFGGTAVRYIPIYNPNDISFIPTGENENLGISNETIGGVIYPEYATFLVKCDPTDEIVVNSSNTTEQLKIFFQGFDPVIFNLRVKAFREGALEYEQRQITSTDNGNAIRPPYGGNLLKTFRSKTGFDIELATTLDGAESIYHAPGITAQFTSHHHGLDTTAGLETNYLVGYYPYGYSDLSTAFTSDSVLGSNLNTVKHYLKISDSSTNTGGVRLYASGILSTDIFPGLISGSSTVYKKFNNKVNDFEYTFYRDQSITEDQNSDLNVTFDGTIDASLADLLENEVIYAEITKNVNNRVNDFITFEQAVGQGQQDERTKFLHPDDSQVSGLYNWRPRLYSIAICYSPYHLDNESEETITLDSISLLHGVYRVFSTSSATLQTNCRIPAIQPSATNFGLLNPNTNFDLTSVVTSSPIYLTENVLGLVDSNYSSVKKDASGHNAPQGEGTTSTTHIANDQSGEISNAGGGIYCVYKHYHPFDYFNLPTIENNNVGTIEHSGLDLRFNNLSGLDGFFQENFDFVTSSGEDISPPVLVSGVQENISNCEVSNRKDFSALKIKTLGGTDISVPRNVFGKGSSHGGGFQTYTGEQYYDTSVYKDVKLITRYEPQNGTELANNPVSGVQEFGSPFDITDPDFDALGRIKADTTINVRQSGLDYIQGATQASNSNTVIDSVDMVNNSIMSTELTFHLYGHCFPTYSVGVGKGILVFTEASNNVNGLTNSQLYITEYAGVNKFGTHDATSSRVLIDAFNNNSLAQPVQGSSTNATTGNGTAFSLKHVYASVTNTKDYYYKKFPANGSAAYKHEQYFKDPITVQKSTANAAYGILPGPVIPGRFNSSNGHAISAFEPKSQILHGRTSIPSSLASGFRYECYIPLNFYNQSSYKVSLVSIELDNEVGNCAFGQVKYGDPRFVLGLGSQDVDASGNISPKRGRYYQTSLSDDANIDVDVAPTLTNTVREATGDGTTTITLTDGNTVGLKAGMVVISDDDAFIPEGTIVVSLDASANTVTLDNAAGSGTGKKLLFDYKQKDYIIWNICKGRNLIATGQNPNAANMEKFEQSNHLDFNFQFQLSSNTSLTGANGVALNSSDNSAFYKNTFGINNHTNDGAQALIGAYVSGPGIKDGTTITGLTPTTLTLSHPATVTAGNTLRIQQPEATGFSAAFFDNSATMKNALIKTTTNISNTPVNISDLGKIKRSQNNTFAQGDATTLGDRTFYGNFDNETDASNGAPHIYFAADTTGVGDNDIDDSVFYNKIKIRYIIWNRLDMYGLNNENIDNVAGSEISPLNFSTGNMDKLHVYEDTYLVKVDFTNVQPEVIVSDLEGNNSVNNSAINFGLVKIG